MRLHDGAAEGLKVGSISLSEKSKNEWTFVHGRLMVSFVVVCRRWFARSSARAGL